MELATSFLEMEDGECSNNSRLCWMSPRVSFSQDLPMPDNSIRLSPEKRKWQHTSTDDSSSEFEFRMCSNTPDLARHSQQLHHHLGMLSADELFIDGKLRPLHLLPGVVSSADDLCLPWKSAPQKDFHSQNIISRHLSIESSTHFSPPHHHLRANPVSRSVGNSRCSSPSRVLPPPQTLPPITPASPKAKYSVKIKEFFKPKKPLTSSKDGSSAAQLTRDNSVTSSCRLPISPRSFWPFSRSNSAGESKTTTPAVPALPRRSNSTGESKTSSTAIVSKSADSAIEGGKASSHSNFEKAAISQGKNLHASLSVSDSERKNGEADRSTCVSSTTAQNSELLNSSAAKELPTPCPAPPSPSATPAFSSTDAAPVAVLDQHDFRLEESAVSTEGSCSDAVYATPNTPDQSSHVISTFKDAKKVAAMNVTRVRGSGSPCRVPRRRVSSPSVNFARGSPGRRGVVRNGSESKGNAGKIMLRNLERCSAEAKLGVGRLRDASNATERRNSYPVAVRVTPVLNVAIYRGKAPKPRLFSLGRLFSSKRDKPMETRVNNWRNGA